MARRREDGRQEAGHPEGGVATWRAPEYSPTAAFVYTLSNRGSELMRVWRCDVAAGTWQFMTGEEDALESFSFSPDGRTLALVYDGPTANRLELRDATSRPPMDPEDSDRARGWRLAVAWH